MGDVHTEKLTAELEGDFVVFRIGMRINRLWKVHRWLPLFREMPRMLDELEADSESGLLGYDVKLGVRNHEVVQYWRSFSALREYAFDPDARHMDAIPWTNELMRESDAVGLWHETYLVRDGEYETVYDNMPTWGLGNAGSLVPATGRRRTAAGRIGWTDGEDATLDNERVRSDAVGRPPDDVTG